MSKKSRRKFTREQNAAVVRRHLVDKVPVSNLCDEDGIQPSMFYNWHSIVSDNAAKGFVAAYSINRKASPQPGLLVLGDMSVQGNVKPFRSLVEPLQVATDNGAKRALIPIGNKRQFLEVNPFFCGDLKQAAFKALGLN